MPKGDRLKLKADPEDGTTPVANLLLEAVAMAKLSGLERGAIIYLWRQTYGWVGKDGKRLKECKLTLSDWARALDSTRPRASDVLMGLAEKKVVFRRTTDQWGGYLYQLNTNVASWNSNTINLAKLAETVKIKDFGDVTKNRTVTEKDTVIQNSTIAPKDTVTKEDNSYPKKDSTVTADDTPQLPQTTPPTLYKEILKKDKERGVILEKSLVGEDTRKVFALLDKERGYRPTKRKAEAASIIRMLKNGYTPEQIMSVWKTMKQDKFYQGKELFMMTVESQIGAMIQGGTHQRGIKETSTQELKDSIGKPLSR